MVGAGAGILLLGLITVLCLLVTRAPLMMVLSIAAPATIAGALVGGWTGLRAALRDA